MNKIDDVEEFNSEGENKETEEVDEEPKEGEEEDKESEEEPKEEPKAENKPAPEKFYYFNGRQLTADELFEESNKLHTEYTKVTQQKSKEPEVEYDGKQVEEFKKFAKQLGVVFEGDLNAKEQKSEEKRILETFITSHPEFNDPVKQRELFVGLAQYNTTLPYLSKSLEKAHLDIMPKKNDNDKRAEQTKLSRASTGTPGEKVNKTHNLSDEQVRVMKEMGVWEE